MGETPTARISLGHDGILVVRIRQGSRQRPDDARENLAMAVLVANFTALALLVEGSPLGRIMGNVYFRVARPGIPIHVFTEEDVAIRWLKDHFE